MVVCASCVCGEVIVVRLVGSGKSGCSDESSLEVAKEAFSQD